MHTLQMIPRFFSVDKGYGDRLRKRLYGNTVSLKVTELGKPYQLKITMDGP